MVRRRKTTTHRTRRNAPKRPITGAVVFDTRTGNDWTVVRWQGEPEAEFRQRVHDEFAMHLDPLLEVTYTRDPLAEHEDYQGRRHWSTKANGRRTSRNHHGGYHAKGDPLGYRTKRNSHAPAMGVEGRADIEPWETRFQVEKEVGRGSRARWRVYDLFEHREVSTHALERSAIARARQESLENAPRHRRRAVTRRRRVKANGRKTEERVRLLGGDRYRVHPTMGYRYDPFPGRAQSHFHDYDYLEGGITGRPQGSPERVPTMASTDYHHPLRMAHLRERVDLPTERATKRNRPRRRTTRKTTRRR